jgi:uncharacterized protein (DUF2267 family)
MSMTGLDAFDTTVHKTNRWLNELSELAAWDSKQKAYLAMRATLHALRDRITIDEVAQLGAQLPMLIRGFYYEGWDPKAKPPKERHVDQFLARIAREFRSDDLLEAARMASAVFALLRMRIADGEIEDVKSVLPEEVRHLWP